MSGVVYTKPGVQVQDIADPKFETPPVGSIMA
jgi:hypothetical protein